MRYEPQTERQDVKQQKDKRRTDYRDKLLGARLRVWRYKFEMTQTDLGDAVGVSFQQIQKYEAGFNRISAVRLWQLSQVFDVPVDEFFRDFD